MSNLSQNLRSAQLKIEQIMLDPNNPRFADLGDQKRTVMESHFADESVQNATLDRLLDGEFDIDQLRNSIGKIGYIPVDNIVVREIADSNYVVVEGNRRIAAIKSLLKDFAQGYLAMPPARIKSSMESLEVLILVNSDGVQTDQWIIQGLRHVSGTKAWGPYQQAKAVEALQQQGYNERDAAQTLGMRVGTVATLLRSLKSLEQMQANPEFTEFADPRMFSYFHEIQKSSPLKAWLGWSDQEHPFTDEEHATELYRWITEQEDDEGHRAKRIGRAIDVRDLSAIIQNDAALTAFRTGRPLEYAKQLIPIDPQSLGEWKEIVARATRTLFELPTNVLERLTDEELRLLTDLDEIVQRRVEQREALLSAGVLEPSNA